MTEVTNAENRCPAGRVRTLPHLAADGPIAVTEPVIMEVLAGARTDASETDLRRLLLRFHLHQFDPAADFEGAARICACLR